MADKKPEQKTFSLKPIQSQMLNVLQDQYYATLSNFLSFLALEFWGYQVTPNTRFQVENNNVIITEVEPEEVPDPKKVDVAETSTKDALK